MVPIPLARPESSECQSETRPECPRTARPMHCDPAKFLSSLRRIQHSLSQLRSASICAALLDLGENELPTALAIFSQERET